MRISSPLLALILTATLPVASMATEQPRSQKATAPVTVGDFAVMLAKVSGSGPAVGVKSATDALVRAGVPLGDPKAMLSEKTLAEILGHYGVRAATSSPQQAVSRAKAEKNRLRSVRPIPTTTPTPNAIHQPKNASANVQPRPDRSQSM